MGADLTIGVEEEYLTVDARTAELRPRADRIVGAAEPASGAEVQPELTLAQVEAATPVCRTLDELRAALIDMRASVAATAASRDSAVAAIASHPSGDWMEQAITPSQRFLQLEHDYQQLAREQLICGCHVHVGIDDPDARIRVMDRVRSWAPILLALSANSPYWQGVDTGYASYRTQLFDRWPTAGPPPPCRDRDGYDAAIRELIEIGMIPDETFIYWHLRPSTRYPTLELRVTDVMMTVDDAVTIAGLFRALVAACLDEPTADPAALPSHEAMRAATWSASRYGIDDRLIDLSHGDEVPAREAVASLLASVRDRCDEDEWQALADGVHEIFARGNGARRQREAFLETGSFAEVRKRAIESTLAGSRCSAPERDAETRARTLH